MGDKNCVYQVNLFICRNCGFSKVSKKEELIGSSYPFGAPYSDKYDESWREIFMNENDNVSFLFCPKCVKEFYEGRK